MQVAEGDKNYLAGQFLSISPKQFPELSELVAYFEHIKGKKKEVIRAYSMASAPHEELVSFTVKPERWSEHDAYPPLLSPFLASPYMKGREIEFLGYTGPYTLPSNLEEQADIVLHLTAGSGTVPNFSLLKDQLTQNKNLGVKHLLININKTYDDIIYRDELSKLAAQHPKRFTLVNLLTREEREGYFSGRPTLELLREHAPDPKRVLVYACGSAITKWQRKAAEASGVPAASRFIESVSELITQLGIDKKRFKHESYG
jgi:ferredoxin-NADP reductase